MPFGLATARATFKRAMELVLAGLTYSICLCYLDGALVFIHTIAEHCDRLRAVIPRPAQFTLKLVKMYLCGEKSRLFRAVIPEEGVSPLPSKIEAILHIPVPSTVKDVRSFLGLSGYYRRFIKNYAAISVPLTKLTAKNNMNQFNWTEDCQRAFNALQTCITRPF